MRLVTDADGALRFEEVPDAPPSSGIADWERLMVAIGREDQAHDTQGSLEDRMLQEWCRAFLMPRDDGAADVTDEVSTAVATDADLARIQAELDADEAALGPPEEEEALGRPLEALDEEVPTEFAAIRDMAARMVDAAERSAATQAAAATPEREGFTASVGTVFRSQHVKDNFLLADQFLHKALLIVLDELPGDSYIAAVLNRPTANLVEFNTPDKPRRCISFGGDARLRGSRDVDENGLMWLTPDAGAPRDSRLGSALGDSGLRRLQGVQAITLVQSGQAKLSDFLLLQGVVVLNKEKAGQMVANGELSEVKGDLTRFWPQVFEAANGENAVQDEDGRSKGEGISDGKSLWFRSHVLSLDSVRSPPEMKPIADEALAEWLKFFAGIKPDPEAELENLDSEDSEDYDNEDYDDEDELPPPPP